MHMMLSPGPYLDSRCISEGFLYVHRYVDLLGKVFGPSLVAEGFKKQEYFEYFIGLVELFNICL